jgi:4-amino-4-deoxy-L-arabinose transferase-like glycosyltransferase
MALTAAGGTFRRVTLHPVSGPRRWAAEATSALRAGSPALTALIIVLWALATRAAVFGNPVIDHDDQFYVLVAERMLHGALPYVDIWDRKPIGLFLLYAAMRTLGGEGIVQYQLVACLAVSATAFCIWAVARPLAGAANALWAALLYLSYCLVFDGAAGQSPVFYNLLMIGAAMVILHVRGGALVGALKPGELAILGSLVMLLVGVAIQIKYTVVFEGAFFGLALVAVAARSGIPPAKVVALAVLWMACGLAPTIAAVGAFYALGHLDAFVQANFVSIFYRQESKLPSFGRLILSLVLLSPLFFWAWRGWRAQLVDARARDARLFVAIWSAVGLAGYLGFGSYYDHYALPLLVPLAILAAIGIAARRSSKIARRTLLAVLAFGAFAVGARIYVVGNAAQSEALARIVRANLHGCLFVYEGDTILYKKTNACIESRYVFPSHLNSIKEQGALGVDPVSETRRILARKPSVIVLAAGQRGSETNFRTRRVVTEAIARDYRLVGSAPVGQVGWLVYRRER